MKKRIAFLAAGTALAAANPSAALAATELDPSATVGGDSSAQEGTQGSPIDNEGTGDAVVTLLESSTPAIYPGQESWIVLPWTVENTDAREFKVTSVSSDGIEVGYPENTGSFTSLFRDDTLATFEIDYTAIRLLVDPEAAAPRMLNITLSYVSDTGEHTTVVNLPVAVDESVYEGDGVSFDEGDLGELQATDIGWFSLGLKGLEDATKVELRVQDAGPFEIVYPAERDHSRPRLGQGVAKGEIDDSAIRFAAEDLDPGTYTVTIEATYFVGMTQITTEFDRTITVVEGSSGGGIEGSILYDSTKDAGNWITNPNGTDTATAGHWDISVPEAAEWNGHATQLGSTPSGAPGVITTGVRGQGTGTNDIDNGHTSAISPIISLPADQVIEIEFSYYFAHLHNASNADYFRLTILGESGSKRLIQRTGQASIVEAAWVSAQIDLTEFAGQEIQIFLEAADEMSGSLIEAAVADIRVTSKNL